MSKTAEQTARAHELMAFLIEHPEMHDQDFWIQFAPTWNGQDMTTALAFQQCGTTACAAGWAVLLAGGRIYSGERSKLNGKSEPINVQARELLGLSVEEAHHLFYETHTLDEVCDAIVAVYGPLMVGAS